MRESGDPEPLGVSDFVDVSTDLIGFFFLGRLMILMMMMV